MNSKMCLDWCKECTNTKFPDDYKTAQHATWMIDKASEVALGLDDFMAIEAAKQWSVSLLNKFMTYGAWAARSIS